MKLIRGSQTVGRVLFLVGNIKFWNIFIFFKYVKYLILDYLKIYKTILMYYNILHYCKAELFKMFVH